MVDTFDHFNRVAMLTTNESGEEILYDLPFSLSFPFKPFSL